MAMIQGASAERRPDLATLSDAQAVVEGLLQHSLGMASDLSGLASATQTLIAESIAMLVAVEGEERARGDAATLTGALYALIDDGLANAGDQTMPRDDSEDAGSPPPEADGSEPPPPGLGRRGLRADGAAALHDAGHGGDGAPALRRPRQA